MNGLGVNAEGYIIKRGDTLKIKAAEHPSRRHLIDVWRSDVQELDDVRRPKCLPFLFLDLYDAISRKSFAGYKTLAAFKTGSVDGQFLGQVTQPQAVRRSRTEISEEI